MKSEEWVRSRFRLGPTLSQSSGDTLWNRILREVLPFYLTKRELASRMPEMSAQRRKKSQGEAGRARGGTEIGPISPQLLGQVGSMGQVYSLPPLHTAETPQVPVNSKNLSTYLNVDLLFLKPHSSVEYRAGVCGNPISIF